ncbi:MAG: DUF362 domain-containing protein [Chitinivibrionales bacterium]|nr:DUF362 domain-containing protein [Chitinivibrionales bacterium]
MRKARREFLQTVAGGAMVAAVPGAGAGQSRSAVFTAKGSADKAIPALVEKLGGIEKFVKPKSRVLIKPNMSFSNPPSWGTGTSPLALKTLVSLCLEAGARRVVIADHTIREAALCREKTGFDKVVDPLKGAVLFTPDKQDQFVEKKNDDAKMLTRVELLKELDRADTLICLPTAKSHSAAGVSLGIKGLMGLVWDRSALHAEMDLHQAIAELLYYIKPSLTIVDASRALLDNGPAGPGKVVNLETFVGGIDPVAVDSIAVTKAQWYGMNLTGEKVKHLKIASRLGFGNVATDRIDEIVV